MRLLGRDRMSSRRIEDLVPALQDKYKLFQEMCNAENMNYIVTCTKRSVEEQKVLVAEHKSTTMKSKHLTGEAFDIAVIKDGKVTWDTRDYEPYGDIGEKCGLTWGGHWKTFVDCPHFQI